METRQFPAWLLYMKAADQTVSPIAAPELMASSARRTATARSVTAPLAYLSIDAAAQEIGCSRRFLEMRIEDGELKVFRPSSRMIRIRRLEFERWIESYSSRRGAA